MATSSRTWSINDVPFLIFVGNGFAENPPVTKEEAAQIVDALLSDVSDEDLKGLADWLAYVHTSASSVKYDKNFGNFLGWLKGKRAECQTRVLAA